MIQFRSMARTLMAGAFAAYVASFAVSAQAATVLVEFEGVVTRAGSENHLEQGSTLVGVLTYDTDAPTNQSSSSQWTYFGVPEPFSSFSVYAPDGSLLTQGGSSPGVTDQIIVRFNAGSSDYLNLAGSAVTGNSFLVPSGAQATPARINFRLEDASASVFDTGHLPTELDLDSFSTAQSIVRYSVEGQTGDYASVFTLTSLQVVSPVPEPQTYALMAAGLGLVGAAARRRARK